MSDSNDITAIIATEEPAVAATLDDLRYLVFQGKKGDPGADAEGAVRYDEAQSLTAAQKDQARSNIGAGKTYEAQYGTDSADMLIATIAGHTVVWCKHDGKVFFARTYSSSGHVVYFVCPGASTYFLKVQGTTWSTETYTPFSLPTNGQRGQALLSDGSGGAEWGEGGSSDAVLYTEQDLTDAQKAQARENIGAGTYTKPSGGIPASDLASGVQTSLGKADTALQSHQSLAAYRTATAQDAIDAAQDSAIAAKYTKPSGGIPASDLASGVIPSVPQMATAADMSDWTSGKTVDAAVLKADFRNALAELDDVQGEVARKANASDIPTAVSDLTNDSDYQTAQDVQTAIDATVGDIETLLASI